MTSRRRKVLLASSLALVAITYLSAPVIAGIFGIGNRAGPKIYPQGLHEQLYGIAWESSSHNDGEPRLPAVFRSEYRPWFYGQYSKNDDPVWLKAEYEKLRMRRAVGIAVGVACPALAWAGYFSEDVSPRTEAEDVPTRARDMAHE